MTRPKQHIKGKHLHIERGKGAKEIRRLRKVTAPAPPERPLQVDIDEKTARGVYANAAAVAHGETEFVLDFLFLQTGSSQTKVHSRVISSPRHAMRFLAALLENIQKYEKKFGPIR